MTSVAQAPEIKPLLVSSTEAVEGRSETMVSDSTAIHPPLTRDETGTLLGQTMGLIAVTAGLFALGAYLGRNVAYQWGWLFFIGSLLLLTGVNVAAQRSEQAA